MVFGSCLSIMVTIAYASMGPTPQERFITLSTLGSDMTTRGLYPTSSPLVGEGDTLRWNVQVHNQMGEAEYVAIRLKVLNATQFGPDSERHLPSPVSHIYEEKLALGKGDTAVIPVTITVKDIEVPGDGSLSIRTLVVNGKEISSLGVSNTGSKDFRFVVELWRYDVKFENFVFTWSSGPESESAWNQIRVQVK